MNAVDIAGNRTVNDLLDERAALDPERLAFVVDSDDGAPVSATYSEFRRDVLALARVLARLGVGHGDTVLVQLPNCAEIVLAWFALARLGAIFVPSNPLHTVREIRHVSETAGVSLAIVDSPTLEQAAEATGLAADRVLVVGEPTAGATALAGLLAAEPPSDEVPGVPVGTGDVVEMIFTSGTTAAPKGVLLTHANCLRSGEQIAKSLALTPADRLLTALPVFHVNAQSSTVLAAMTVGASFVLLASYSASRFVGKLREHDATIASLVGTQVRTLLRQPPSPADRDHTVRHVFYAINVSDYEFAEFERRFGLRLLNGYGLSEAMMAVTITPAYGDRRWPSVGLPLVDRVVRVVDEAGEDCPLGQVGEIVVGGVPGRTLMAGYHGNPEATASALRDGWLHTGDSGRLDERGYLYFVDRKKDMIKRSGENVSAREIETVLEEHAAIVEAAVIGVADDVRDEAIVAFVTTASRLTVAELLEYCRSNLAPYKLPSRIEFLEAMPKTSIGKIEKKALRALADAAAAAPATDPARS